MVPADEIEVEAVSVNQVAKDLQRVPVAITLTMDRNQTFMKDPVPATIDQAQGRVSRTSVKRNRRKLSTEVRLTSPQIPGKGRADPPVDQVSILDQLKKCLNDLAPGLGPVLDHGPADQFHQYSTNDQDRDKEPLVDLVALEEDQQTILIMLLIQIYFDQIQKFIIKRSWATKTQKIDSIIALMQV